MALILPKGYRPNHDVRQTERAIHDIRRIFERHLAAELDLERASAPPMLLAGTGLNDDLNGRERKVTFTAPDGQLVEVPNSLAKWKRWALAKYGYKSPSGLWTDMNAMRPDEERDNIHSIYVDQWDWEKVITVADRTPEFLKAIVSRIYRAIKKTAEEIKKLHGFSPDLPDNIVFVSTEQLHARDPSLSRKDREHEITKEHGAVFLMGIGHPLADGEPHDGRAPDYDDWSTQYVDSDGVVRRGLNGDILVWNPVLETSLELSSMGIRVDPAAMLLQLEMAKVTDRANLMFHKMLLGGELPFTIGGGIGQSRLSMYLLGKAHIGEVQAGVWPQAMVDICSEHGIYFL